MRLTQASGISEQGFLKRYVANTSFDIFFASLVMSNAIFIGVEVQEDLNNPEGHSMVLQAPCLPVPGPLGPFLKHLWARQEVIRNSYTLLFTLEIILRICTYQRDFFCSPSERIWSLGRSSYPSWEAIGIG